MPDNVIKKKDPSVIPLAIEFSNVINDREYNDIDREWRLLQSTDLNIESDVKNLNFEYFWSIVATLTNGLDEPLFPLFTKLIQHILILPHSNAAAERIFSAVNLNKTKLRNRISTSTLNGILHAKTVFDKDSACQTLLLTTK